MIYNFNKVNYQPSVFELEISPTTNYERKIIVVGYDPKNDKRIFFLREIYLNRPKDKYYLTAPITSEQVSVMLFDINNRNSDETFRVDKIVRKELAINTFITNKKTNNFITFIKGFTYYYSSLKYGWVYDKNREFRILNSRTLEVPTPSRIDTIDNHIEVYGLMFDELSIPQMIMILLHEYSHNYLNKNGDSETEADINGLNIYLKLGFPATEAVYAFTGILRDNIESHERLQNILAFIENYNKNNKKYLNRDDKTANYMDMFKSYNLGRL
jgi:hypothetical protein